MFAIYCFIGLWEAVNYTHVAPFCGVSFFYMFLLFVVDMFDVYVWEGEVRGADFTKYRDGRWRAFCFARRSK